MPTGTNSNTIPYYFFNGISGWYGYSPTTNADIEWYEALVRGIAEVLLDIGEELEKTTMEPDEAYKERLQRDLKAQGYEKMFRFLESMI